MERRLHCFAAHTHEGGGQISNSKGGNKTKVQLNEYLRTHFCLENLFLGTKSVALLASLPLAGSLFYSFVFC
jgi:hypothetical protein